MMTEEERQRRATRNIAMGVALLACALNLVLVVYELFQGRIIGSGIQAALGAFCAVGAWLVAIYDEWREKQRELLKADIETRHAFLDYMAKNERRAASLEEEPFREQPAEVH